MHKTPAEHEKDKEAEKTAEEENYEYSEGEEVEDAQEGAELEEGFLSEKSLPYNTGQTAGNASGTEVDVEDMSEGARKRREKWLTLTGKKPRNIPVIKRYYDSDPDKIILFGERRQLEVEKKIAERMMLASKKLNTKARNLGKVRNEVWLPALCDGLMCIRFEPNAQTVATGYRNGVTKVQKRETGELVLDLKTIEATEKLPVRCIRYHPIKTEMLYLSGDSGVIQVFDLTDGRLTAASEDITTVNCMDITSDGGFLVTGGKDGKIHVIDTSLLQVVSKRAWPEMDETTLPEVVDQYHRLRIYGAKFHPENENLFVTGACDRSVKIWDVRTGPAIRSINGPSVYGDGVDISNNIILTAAWEAENGLSLWDFSTGKLIKSVPIKNHYTKFDGEFLFAGQFFKNDPSYPSVNSNLIAVGGGGFTQLLVINIKTEKVMAHFPSFKPIFCLDLVGNMVAYGGKESVYRIGEVEEGIRSNTVYKTGFQRGKMRHLEEKNLAQLKTSHPQGFDPSDLGSRVFPRTGNFLYESNIKWKF